jgi:hypothetical protein
LTGVVFVLASSDPDVACIAASRVDAGDLPTAGTISLGSLDPGDGGFTFRASDRLASSSLLDASRINLCLHLAATELAGSAGPYCLSLLADLDLPAGAEVTLVPGPDGSGGTSDDGVVFESFDVDRDGSGRIEISDGRDAAPNDTIGMTVGTMPGGADVLAAVACAGFQVPPQNPDCRIDPDNDMDWHLHCPTGACDPPYSAGAVASHLATPAGGELAFSGRNSLHWGIHADLLSRLGDTVSHRSMAAFVTRPINLTPLPRPGEPGLSFGHIADLMDDNEPQLNVAAGQAVDYADVQIRADRDSDPLRDDWGAWEKLVPFANVYDHIPYIWSWWGSSPTYCTFTPADTGSAPPAPRGVHETMCYPTGVWSHCGNAWGTGTTYQCPGPGLAGRTAPDTGALWVRTQFSLERFAGARVQVRWIAQSWEFEDPCVTGFCDPGYGSWEGSTHDDGWWVDDIALTGAIETQATPVPDMRAAPATTCPSGTCPGPDEDEDLVPDGCDNCPAARNPFQEDADRDSQGDLCDLDDDLIYVLARDRGSLVWQPERGFDRFVVYRGSTGPLLDGDGDGAADAYPVCVLAADLAATEFPDPAAPGAGAAFFYLVTGLGASGEGSPGSASGGASRTLAPTGTCP